MLLVKAMVTGGAGFIGSHLASALLADGHEVLVVDDLSTGRHDNLEPGVGFECLDILEREALARLTTAFSPQVIFHLAAQTSVGCSVRDPVHDARVNILGSLNVIAAACCTGAVLVYASSAACYGQPLALPISEDHLPHPVSPYGASKLVVEGYLSVFAHTHRLASCSLRLANVYGPRQSAEGEAGVVSVFVDRALNGLSPTIHGDGNQTRDFVYVGDVVEAFQLAAMRPRGVYNIGTGREHTVSQLWEMLAGHAHDLGVRVRAPVTAAARPGDIYRSVFDCTRAHRELGWQARTGLREGLALTLAASRVADHR
ncbi:MAG: GDP-mannose 4,6-dehydratase [Bacillota bacterium]